MGRNPKRVFIIILILTVISSFISIPENFHIGSLGPIRIDRDIHPPTVDFTIGSFRIYKEFRTRLGLDLSGGTHVVLDADMNDIASGDRLNALESAKQVIERRVNFFGVSEPVVQTAYTKDSYRIIVELPGVTNVDQAVSTIGRTASLEFREFTDMTEATAASTAADLYLATKSVGITGKDLKRATLTFSTQNGEPEVAIEFTGEGAKKFADATKRLVEKPLPIFLDGFIVSSPVVKQEITDGNAVINGSFTKDTAKMLATQLNAGALPVPVHVVEKKVVGATLGQESVTQSIRAGAIGLLIVAIFMIVKYGFLGLIADIALILYGLFSFAIFRWIPVTLTLPGITGFILSIGMAVDSNILIFERFREEKRNGKPWQIAMELGFGKAWDSIRDANFTTLITCLILFNPGNLQFLPSSGLVRGFAVTLFIGVLVGLFTGIVVSRTLIRLFYRERSVK